MKKYNTPVIEALALETIDVIATSGHVAAIEALGDKVNGGTYVSQGDISDFQAALNKADEALYEEKAKRAVPAK